MRYLLPLLLLLAPLPVSAAPDPGSIVKVNQVAYVPGTPKIATLVNGSGSPVSWTLRDSGGTTVASGQSAVKGADALSGDNVHLIDFSAFDTVGTGYVLSAAGGISYPFDISSDAMRRMRTDSLAFFYHQRSGIAIDPQFVGSAYARPAGHLGISPNQGDTNVPCRNNSCGYTLDVRGGWYDAGDHGKYVVNGGISAWQLQNIHERNPAAYGDGSLSIPERANGAPDILDEARWEVDFLLRMQAPDGMAHHKMHDANWTGIPTRPDLDSQPRQLAPVSTAATLNLAAVAAQSARLWRTLDPAFSARALTAARKAYTAAKANPARYAPSSDNTGGGPYEDDVVTDEFYWAAAELYATTGESSYRTDVTSSSLYKGAGFASRGFDWQWVAGLGDVTLSIVPNGLPTGDITATRNALIGFADRALNQAATQGYPTPISTYVWGSNGQIVNNASVLALAFDFTGQARYRNGVYQALDYLLGRNPLNQSYVSGYGEKAVRNVHHRFWANQANSAYPIAPPGSLSGGPNPMLQDPVAQAQLQGCKAQKCFIDDIGAYSVNEVTINWNSGLAWVAHWAFEKATPPVGDTTPPTVPGTPVASAITSSSVNLTWSPSTDNISVTGYAVFRDGTEIATTSSTSYTSTGLTPATTYRYHVRARDAAGNWSGNSVAVTVTTQSAPIGGCRIDYTPNSWGNGFTANVTVNNTGSTVANGWTVTWSWSGNQQVTSAWNAVVTQSGTTVSATNMGYNATIPPAGSQSFGFQGTYSGTNTSPSAFNCTLR